MTDHDRARLERQLGRPLPDLTRDERSALLEVLTAEEASNLLAWIAGYAPEMFDAALAARGRGFADKLRARPGDADEDDGDEPDGDEPYCTCCDSAVGMFQGQQAEGWRHCRGDGTAASPVELYDADHAPVVGWRPLAHSGA